MESIKNQAMPLMIAITNNPGLSADQKREQSQALCAQTWNRVLAVLTPAQRALLKTLQPDGAGLGTGTGAGDGMFAKLNLTDAQKGQVAAVYAASKQQVVAVVADSNLSTTDKLLRVQQVKSDALRQIESQLTESQKRQLHQNEGLTGAR
jgi:hypothetical protein